MTECLLHVYDVTNADSESTNLAVQRFNAVGRYTSIGGVFHGGIEVYGKEWSFGLCERGTGVYMCSPKDNPMYTYRETISLGRTALLDVEVAKLIQQLKDKWRGYDYDMMTKNCNHFCQEFANLLGVSAVPGWLNRMAYGAEAVANASAYASEQVQWMSNATASWWKSWNPALPQK